MHRTSNKIRVITLDIKTAFDRAWYKGLMEKLSSFGIHGDLHYWIAPFLSDRQQSVVLDGSTSSAKPISADVPQGSILGPLLCLMFYDDLASHLDNGIDLFADDSALHIAIKNTCDKIICAETSNVTWIKSKRGRTVGVLHLMLAKQRRWSSAGKEARIIPHSTLWTRNYSIQIILLFWVSPSPRHCPGHSTSHVLPNRQQSVSISWAVLETSFLIKLISLSTRLTSDLLWNMLPQSGMEQELRLWSC